MIEKNLGNIERVFRLVFGLVFGAWVIMQPNLDATAWFVLAVSMMLILNGVFSRCYLWFILDINTSKHNDHDSPKPKVSC